MANPAVGNAIVCRYCKCFHPPNVACQLQPPSTVYSTAIAADANVVGQGNFNLFIIPVIVNPVNTMVIRDSGNLSPFLVDPSLVCDHDHTSKSVFLKGTFGGPGVCFGSILNSLIYKVLGAVIVPKSYHLMSAQSART